MTQRRVLHRELVSCCIILPILLLLVFIRKTLFLAPLLLAQSKTQLQSASSGFRVLAFSLYGNSSRYTDGAVANAKLHRWIYRDWVMQVYHDKSTPQGLLSRLTLEGVHLVDMSASDLNPMNWRFLAASDEEVNVLCSRDIDSRLSIREFSAVSEWLETDFLVHMIRDHPGHMHHPMMGGLWCAKRGAIPDIRSLLAQYSRESHFNADQEFLRDEVWPIVSKSVLHHANFGCELWEESRPIPSPRVGLEHVGAVYIEHLLRDEDANILRDAISKGEECLPPLAH